MLYPQQNEFRESTDLSGLWEFRLDPENRGVDERWFEGLKGSRLIAVPGSWNEQFDDAHDYFGVAWYEKHFYVARGWKNKRVFLRVGSANYRAAVWVNGRRVGDHEGGHLPFSIDITDSLHWKTANVVAIQVENFLRPERVPAGGVQNHLNRLLGGYPNVSFDFFPYSGIHRPVFLFAVPAKRIEDITVVSTLKNREASVHISVDTKGVFVSGSVSLIGDGTEIVTPLEWTGTKGEATVSLPSPRLWCPSDPFLYQVLVSVAEHGEIADRYVVETGIRSVSIKGTKLLLNGEPVHLRGFGRHEDFFVSGRGQNLPVSIRDHELMKWVGANSFRTAHYPYSEEEMQLADRNGFLVIDEIPAVSLGFGDSKKYQSPRFRQCRKQLTELIARDKNHPSVIAWCVSNEAMPKGLLLSLLTGKPAKAGRASTDFLKRLLDLSHELDPTRPAVLVTLAGAPVEWLELSDIICINRYNGWYSETGRLRDGFEAFAKELEGLSKLKKPVIVTEFGADTIPGRHSQPSSMWSEEFQADYIEGMLDTAESFKYVVGTHIWNLADFKTSQSILRPGSMNHKGIFTRSREPKMAAHLLRLRWRKI